MVVSMLQKAAIAFVGMIWAQVALAQSWVQVEAQPTAQSALVRAQEYALRLQDVNAFRLGTNWHAIAIGPFATEDGARSRLLELRAARAVPSDSFVSDGRNFRDRIFGTGVALVEPDRSSPAQPLVDLEPGEETEAEARRNERNLDRREREMIQIALKWEGHYDSVIDAAFGPGTRRAMAGWQETNGYEPTGVMTTVQRRELLEAYDAAVTSLDLAPVVDAKAGIEIELPLGAVEFARYEAPFAHYDAVDGDAARVILISQSGDEQTLIALFDILQTLEITPLGAETDLGRQSFTISGQNEKVRTHIFARLAGDAVKGFALIWPADDARRFELALNTMQESFRTNDAVLPDTASSGAQDIDLMAGLQIRRADRTRSGFYIDGAGRVLTTREAVQQCSRITLDEDVDAEVAASDDARGLALLRPVQSLSPLSVARLAAAEPRIQSDIAVAGYSFGGLLPSPSITFGTLADLKGLDGDTTVQRLSVANEPGDAGGPVFDGSGVVLGMLLDSEEGDRKLPDDVAFAANAPTLIEFLSANGVTPAAADPGGTMPPEDLTLYAANLTVLVSCWN